jgi:hypothetical protein
MRTPWRELGDSRGILELVENRIFVFVEARLLNRRCASDIHIPTG